MIIKEMFDLTQYNAYRVKATCARAIFPETAQDVVEAYQRSAPRITIGSGHNLLLSKPHYDEEFVIFNGNFNRIEVTGTTIWAEAGATLQAICEAALGHELTGMETFWDIPSSLGGAVAMNAGASGDEIKDVLKSVTYLDLTDGQIKKRENAEIGFQYRNSFFQDNADTIVLDATLELKPGVAGEIRNKMETTKEKRWEKQPREYPNCGSVFKRPEGRFVGPMLDELGLKGFTIGGAQVSEKHSGFIVNRGGATGADIVAVIREVQARVRAKFDIDLQVEQRII